MASLEKSDNMRESETSSEDVFLGHVKLDPRWDEQMQDDWFTLLGGTGKVRVQVTYKRDNVRSCPEIACILRTTNTVVPFTIPYRQIPH